MELNLADDGLVVAPKSPCVIGVPLLSNSTPRGITTVVGVGPRSTLALDGVTVGRGCRISANRGARLEIGEGTSLTDGCFLAAGDSIVIGRDCAISWGVTILDDDGHGIGPPPYSAPIVIGDHVWIGCNATILKGVTIGAGSIVAAGAVVTRSCPPNSLLAGVPARVIREGVHWTDEARLSLERSGSSVPVKYEMPAPCSSVV